MQKYLKRLKCKKLWKSHLFVLIALSKRAKIIRFLIISINSKAKSLNAMIKIYFQQYLTMFKQFLLENEPALFIRSYEIQRYGLYLSGMKILLFKLNTSLDFHLVGK